MRDLIDPTLLAGLDFMPAFEFTGESLPMIRTGLEEMAAMVPEPEGTGVSWQDDIATTAGSPDVPVRIYRPTGSTAEPLPLILQIHGGGYIIGSHRISHAANMVMAAALEAVVVSVDYRLAPEVPAPGSVEDCYTALTWAVAQADRIGIDAGRVAVRGESAGGGLAASLCQLARDRGGPAIAHQNLIYPMLDDRTCTAAVPEHIGAYVWTPPSNHFGWSALLGCAPGSDVVPAYAVPARAESLEGLPAAFIAVGALDLFLMEDLSYAQRLIEAKVPTELHVYAGAYHGFDVVADAAPVQRMNRDAMDALRRALHP